MSGVQAFSATLLIILVQLICTSAIPTSLTIDIYNETNTLSTENNTMSNDTDGFSLTDYQNAYKWLNHYGYMLEVSTHITRASICR